MCCPNLIREVSSCHTRKLTQKPALDNDQSTKGSGVLGPKWHVFIRSLPSRLRELCGNGRGKDCKRQKWWMALRNSVFQAQQGWHTLELTDPVAACTGCAYTQAAQNPSTEERQWMPIPTRNWETINNQYLLETRILICYTPGQDHGQEYLANTKRSPCIFV